MRCVDILSPMDCDLLACAMMLGMTEGLTEDQHYALLAALIEKAKTLPASARFK